MACLLRQFVMFASVLTAALTGIGSGLRLLAEPQSFTYVKDKQLKIICQTDEPLPKETIRHFEITKEGFNKPILMIANDEAMSTGPNFKDNMEAEGKIDRDSGNPYIRLTINYPDLADAGVYTCLMIFVDTNYKWYEENAKTTVTVVEQDKTSVTSYLVEKVFQLETELKQQNIVNTEQDKALKEQNDVNSRQDKFLKEHIDINSEQYQAVKQEEQNKSSVTSYLVEKVLQLETELKQQNNVNSEQDKALKEQNDVISRQDKVLKEHIDISTEQYNAVKQEEQNKSSVTSYLVEKVLQLETEVKQQNNVNSEQDKALKEQNDVISRQDKVLKEHIDLSTQQNNAVKQEESFSAAFSAYGTERYIIKGEVLVFRNVDLNIGNCYDTKTGVFTTPKDGLYVFHLFARTYDNEEFLVELKVNDVIVAELDSYDKESTEQTSISTVNLLKEGDRVWPHVHNGARLAAPWLKFTMYSGYLLKLM